MSGSIWKKDISLRRASQEAEAQTDTAAVVPDEPVADAPALPAGDYGWLTTDFDANATPGNMPAITPPAVEVPPVTSPAPVSVPAPAAAAPEPAPEPVAAQPEPAVAPPAPFWKRELSLKRKPKEPKPVAASGDYRWLTAGFDPNDVPQEMPVVAAPKVDQGKPPFWKRELKLSKEKAPKEPKAAKEPKPAKEPKEPFWKRDLSRSKAPKEATRQPKEKQPPFWKRDLSLSKPKGEKQAKPSKASRPKKSAASKGAVVGLKIGASQVAAARVANGASPQLLQVARVPLADGVVVGGELRDVEALSQALKELFTKNKLPKRNVRLGIANNRIGVRTFEITGIDEPRQLANAIRFRAQETLPIPLEEAALDWQVLDEWTDEESGQITRRVLLVVAYRELVDRYVMACKKAGLKLSGIDLEAFAMLRALSAPREGDAETAGAQVVVNVGHDRSTFAVSDGRVCEFTRVLGWGGQSLSVAIARALDMTPSEAMPIKHALSLVARAEEPEEFSPQALATARAAVTTELQAFARELVSSLRFYQNQPGSLGIAEVVLTGGTATMPGFADELHRLIGVPVRVGDPLNRVAIPKKLQTPDDVGVGSLTVAIGLGIED